MNFSIYNLYNFINHDGRLSASLVTTIAYNAKHARKRLLMKRIIRMKEKVLETIVLLFYVLIHCEKSFEDRLFELNSVGVQNSCQLALTMPSNSRIGPNLFQEISFYSIMHGL